MIKLYWFPTPNEFKCVLEVDITGSIRIGHSAIHPSGRIGQVFDLPEDTPFGHTGASLDMTLDGYEPMRFRGILNKSEDGFGYINIDDVHGIKKVICPEVPIPVPPGTNPNPSLDPFTIIKSVYATGQHELVTKEGCGKFTEACCTELHNKHSNNWGHIKKIPPQNLYNGHSVDAIQLKVATANCAADVFDIIINSESEDAEPAFNSKGPFIPSLWYYPA